MFIRLTLDRDGQSASGVTSPVLVPVQSLGPMWPTKGDPAKGPTKIRLTNGTLGPTGNPHMTVNESMTQIEAALAEMEIEVVDARTVRQAPDRGLGD